MLFGGNMIRSVRPEKSEWADIPAKFEAGTLPIAEAVALGTAVEFAERLGMDRIAAHEHELTRIAWEGLSAIPGLRILGPGLEHRGAILSFAVDGVHPFDLGGRLDSKGIAVRVGHHCAMPLHESLGLTASTRASFAPLQHGGRSGVLRRSNRPRDRAIAAAFKPPLSRRDGVTE